MSEQELNERVAVKVMGWHKEEDAEHYWFWFDSEGTFRSFSDGCEELIEHEWSPSTDISDAWQVVEEMRRRHMMFTLRDLITEYGATFDDYGHIHSGRGKTAPEAICLAALAACEAAEKVVEAAREWDRTTLASAHEAFRDALSAWERTKEEK